MKALLDYQHRRAVLGKITVVRAVKKAERQRTQRYIRGEVEELFREAQEESKMWAVAQELMVERDLSNEVWDDSYGYYSSGCECCGNYDYEYEPDYYESLWDPREKYAMAAFLSGEWTPPELNEPDHSYTDDWWLDEVECFEYSEWDNEYEPEELPEPPQHERAYNRAQARKHG